MMDSSAAMKAATFQRRLVMEQTQYPTSGTLQLGRVVAEALVEIERLGYSKRSRCRYRAIWKHLIEFSRQNKLGEEFSPDLAARFLEEYRIGNWQFGNPLHPSKISRQSTR
jgi:hypothetical protein